MIRLFLQRYNTCLHMSLPLLWRSSADQDQQCMEMKGNEEHEEDVRGICSPDWSSSSSAVQLLTFVLLRNMLTFSKTCPQHQVMCCWRISLVETCPRKSYVHGQLVIVDVHEKFHAFFLFFEANVYILCMCVCVCVKAFQCEIMAQTNYTLKSKD